MKKNVLTGVMVLAFVGIIKADCTVTTDCETRSYEGNSASASISNGVVTVTQDGQTIDTFTCESGGVYVSCSSSGGGSYGDYDYGNYGNYGDYGKKKNNDSSNSGSFWSWLTKW